MSRSDMGSASKRESPLAADARLNISAVGTRRSRRSRRGGPRVAKRHGECEQAGIAASGRRCPDAYHRRSKEALCSVRDEQRVREWPLGIGPMRIAAKSRFAAHSQHADHRELMAALRPQRFAGGDLDAKIRPVHVYRLRRACTQVHFDRSRLRVEARDVLELAQGEVGVEQQRVYRTAIGASTAPAASSAPKSASSITVRKRIGVSACPAGVAMKSRHSRQACGSAISATA